MALPIGPITKVLGPVGKGGKAGCTSCGMTGLSWVQMLCTDGQRRNRIVPTASIVTDASGGFQADISEAVHPLVYSGCEARIREKAANAGAPAPAAAPLVEQTIINQSADVTEFSAKLAEVEAKLTHLDAFTQTLDERQGKTAPLVQKISDLISTELDGMRQDIQRYRTSAPVEITLLDGTGQTVASKNLGRVHNQLANLIAISEAIKGVGMVYLVGEAGSFKSTAFGQYADAIGQRYMVYTAGPMMNEIDIFGFRNANGDPVDPWGFCDFYENGGIICIDEVGNASPNGLTAINGLTSNHAANFSKGMVAKHPECRFVVADNTYGRGADPMYVGRNQLDAATLSRMVYLPWDTDWTLLSESLGLDEIKGPAPSFKAPGKPREADNVEVKAWGRWVYRVKQAVDATQGGVRAIVSSRAVIMGQRLLMAGIDRKLVEYSTVWGHMSSQDAATIKANI